MKINLHVKMGVVFLAFLIPGIIKAQNLLNNGNFESSGGSLEGWMYTANTELRIDGSDHYAYLWGENGVLYQKVTGVTPATTYTCTISFRNLYAKQTTGYGYAIETGTPLIIPEFTVGATNLRTFCESNNGFWVTLPADLIETNVQKSFTIDLPANATAVYICMGTKGALATYEISEVSLIVPPLSAVTFLVTDKVTNKPVEGAEIIIAGLPAPVITGSNGSGTVNLPSKSNPYNFIVRRDWYQRFESTFTASSATIQVNVSLDSIYEVKKVETRISKYGENLTPYPLYGHCWNSSMIYTDDLISHIASSLDYIVGGSGVPIDPVIVNRLKAIDPAFQVIRYQGGWSTGKANAEADKYKLQYYRCGILSSTITESTTTFSIDIPPDGKGIGLYASEPGKFDTWIRMGNELMKIISVSSQTAYPITVTVQRGFDGSAKAAFNSETTVTAPLYTVSPVPGGSNTDLSYFTTVFDYRKFEIKENALEFANLNGSDGVWIDILVGWLSATSMTGGSYSLWDFNENSILTNSKTIEYTKDAVQQIFNLFYARAGYFPVIYGNNVLYSSTLSDSDRGYMMVETPEHIKVIDGFCHENSWGHMSDDPGAIDNDGTPVESTNMVIIPGTEGRYLEWYVNDSWISNNKAIALLAQQNLPNQPMTINAGFKNQWFAENLSDEVRYQFNKFAYASYLMCVEVAPDRSISCRMGISAQVRKDGNLTVALEPFFYYPIGIPSVQYSYSNFTNYRVGSNNLYARKFSNGIVLINPFKNDMTASVQLSSLTGNDSIYFNPEAGTDPVTTINLKSRNSLILIKSTDQSTSVEKTNVEAVQKLIIYPVPARDKVNITLKGESRVLADGMNEISMFCMGTLIGNYLVNFSGGEAQLDVSDLKPGVYFIRLNQYGIFGKFIKN